MKIPANEDGALPSSEQISALQAWKQRKGRTWKQALRDAWMVAGGRDSDYTPQLQQLRNSFGPTWLGKVKLS